MPIIARRRPRPAALPAAPAPRHVRASQAAEPARLLPAVPVDVDLGPTEADLSRRDAGDLTALAVACGAAMSSRRHAYRGNVTLSPAEELTA